MPAVTRCLLCAAVLVTGLIQTQRLTPSALCFPASLGVALAQPWRLVTAFLYCDGFSLAFVFRLHLISCLSHTLEFALAGPHIAPCPSSAATLFAAAGKPLERIAPTLQYGLVLAGAVLLVSCAAAGRPADMGAPFLMTPLLFFFAYLSSRLHLRTAMVIGGVGLPHALWLPYGLLLVLAMARGAAVAISALAGVGSGLFFELFDIVPLAEPLASTTPAVPAASAPSVVSSNPPAKEKGTKAAAAAAAASAVAATDAEGSVAAVPPRQGLSRRTAMTLYLLALGTLLQLCGVELEAPPVLPNSQMYAAQARQLINATGVNLSDAPVATFLDELGDAVGVNASRLARPSSQRGPKALSATQVLKVYQHVANFWTARTAAARATGSGHSLRAKGSREKGAPQLTDEQTAELEKVRLQPRRLPRAHPSAPPPPYARRLHRRHHKQLMHMPPPPPPPPRGCWRASGWGV